MITTKQNYMAKIDVSEYIGKVYGRLTAVNKAKAASTPVDTAPAAPAIDANAAEPQA